MYVYMYAYIYIYIHYSMLHYTILHIILYYIILLQFFGAVETSTVGFRNVIVFFRAETLAH